jgi:hypothetical protein
VNEGLEGSGVPAPVDADVNASMDCQGTEFMTMIHPFESLPLQGSFDKHVSVTGDGMDIIPWPPEEAPICSNGEYGWQHEAPEERPNLPYRTGPLLQMGASSGGHAVMTTLHRVLPLFAALMVVTSMGCVERGDDVSRKSGDEDSASSLSTEDADRPLNSMSAPIDGGQFADSSLDVIRQMIRGRWRAWCLDAVRTDSCGEYVIGETEIITLQKGFPPDTLVYHVADTAYVTRTDGTVDTLHEGNERVAAYLLMGEPPINFYIDYLTRDTLQLSGPGVTYVMHLVRQSPTGHQ